MKARIGFVSNSSSSSFFIAAQERRPSEEELCRYLGVVPDSPAAKLVEPFVQLLCGGTELSIEDLLDYYGYRTVEELREECYGKPTDVLKLLQDGWKVYEVRVSSEDFDNPASLYLYENEGALDCDTPGLKIIS
jgi:hypothetical protein